MRHDVETANRLQKSKTALEKNLDIIIEGSRKHLLLNGLAVGLRPNDIGRCLFPPPRSRATPPSRGMACPSR
jgi:hypothetical protein